MEIQSNQKLKDKMAILSPHLSIIILNVNGLNSHIERHRVLDGLKNQMETIFGGKCAVGRRRWHPTPVLLPGKSRGRRSPVGCSPRGRSESDRTELLHFHFLRWRRKWQPTPVFLPGESQGQGSLVGCHLWGGTESDTTEATQQQQCCRVYRQKWNT